MEYIPLIRSRVKNNDINIDNITKIVYTHYKRVL